GRASPAAGPRPGHRGRGAGRRGRARRARGRGLAGRAPGAAAGQDQGAPVEAEEAARRPSRYARACVMGWLSLPFAGLDFETTGVDPESDRVVSAAVVLRGGGRPTARRSWLSDVGGAEIPAAATAV